MKTRAQKAGHNFDNGDFIIINVNDREVYREDSTGYWVERYFDENDHQVWFQNSEKYWIKREYDEKGNEIYSETSKGDWLKRFMITTIKKFFTKIQTAFGK